MFPAGGTREPFVSTSLKRYMVPLGSVFDLPQTSAISRERRVSSSYVRRLCRTGKILAVKPWPGGHWRIYPLAITGLVAEVTTHSSRARPVVKLTPGRGVVKSPRAHGSRSLIHKKKKGKGITESSAGAAVIPPILERISQPEDNLDE